MRLPAILISGREGLFPLLSGFALLLVTCGLVTFFVNAKPSSRVVQQPIRFNHKIHVEDQGLECSVCHTHYATGISSGLPGTAACALCHSEPQGDSAAEAELVKRLQEGKSLEWVSVFRQPPHVFFSHRRHVIVAKLECTQCHGDIGSSTSPPERTMNLRMNQCLQCHVENQVSTDCVACHR